MENKGMQCNKKLMRIWLCLLLNIQLVLIRSVDGFTIIPVIPGSTSSKTKIRKNDNFGVFGTNNENSEEESSLSFEKAEIKKLKRRCVAGVIGLGLTAGLSLSNPKEVLAMGPNLAGPSTQKEVVGMELARKMAQIRAARVMTAEKKALDDEGTKIFKEKGSEAYQEFLRECETKRVAEKERRAVEREELINDLILVQEVDPFKSLKGKAALYMYDHGIDLYKVPGTEQEAFERLKKMFPEKYADVEVRQQEATRDKVQQLRDQGLQDDDILTQFIIDGDKYAKIGEGRGRDLDSLQSIRDKRKNKMTTLAPASPITKPQTSSLSDSDNNIDPTPINQEKDTAATANDDSAHTKADEHKAAKQKEKEEIKAAELEEKAQIKAAKAIEKEKATSEASKRKELAKEKKAEAKAMKEKEKNEMKVVKLAAKAAAAASTAAATGASAAVTAAPTSLPSISETSTAIEQQTTTLKSINAIDQQESQKASSDDDDKVSSDVSTITTSQEKTNMLTANNYKIPKVIAGTSFIGATSLVSLKIYNDRSKEKELERKRQFDLLMGTTEEQQSPPPSSSADDILADQESTQPATPSEPTIPESSPLPSPPTNPYANTDPNVEIDIQTPVPQFLAKKNKSSPSPPVQQQQIAQDITESSLPPSTDKKKGRGGTIASLFKKNSSDKRPSTLSKLYSSTPHKSFAQTLSEVLTLGAPGRFPDVSPPQPPNESTQTYKDNLKIKLRDIPIDQSADVFANVVNCMLIHIVDLASSTVVNTNKKNSKKKSENDKIVVDGVSVVLDFMDFGAQLYEDLFNDYEISPVTYSGSLSKSKLENLFSTYATAQMTNFDTGLANNQDRIDTLQRVFNIPDKRAEGLLQKTLMNNFMTMMKDGGGDGDGGAMAEMMKGLAGDGSSPFPGVAEDGADVNPEDIQQSIKLMKELMESGSISKEEIALVKDQFGEVYGTDINKFLQEAEGEEENLDDDGKELLNLFKDVLKE